MAESRKLQFVRPALITATFGIISVLTFYEVVANKQTSSLHISILDRVDAPIHDRLFRVRNYLTEQPVSQDIALVGIDDYTSLKLGNYGKGDWITRKPYLRQIEYFRKYYTPAVIAYDIIFAEVGGEGQKNDTDYDPHEALPAIIKAFQAYSDGDTELVEMEVLTETAQFVVNQGDYGLAQAFANETNTLIAFTLDDSRQEKKWSPKYVIGDDPDDYDEDNGLVIPYLRDVSIPNEYVHNMPDDYPYYLFANTPSNILLDYCPMGYLNVPRDEGGVVRRYPIVSALKYSWRWPEGHPEAGEIATRVIYVPSLSLLACLYRWGIDLKEANIDGTYVVNGKPIIEVTMGKAVTINKPDGETVKIPIDIYGNLYLDFVGRIRDFANVSFADVGPYKAHPKAKDLLNDRIAFVGMTQTGVDVGPCPVDDNTSLVLTHMVAASNILTQTFIRPLEHRVQFLVLCALWLVIMPAALFLRPLKFTYCVALLLLFYCVCTWLFLSSHTYLLPATGPLLFIIISYILVVLFYYFSEEKEKKKIRGMFSTMVSGDVLSFLEENPESFSLAGRKAEATMFFSDVAGFTTISESLTPEKLVELLNAYLSPMTEIIMESNGYVDKYEGDAIMAEWGVPYPNPDHAKLACWAALDQQTKLAELRPIFQRDFGIDVQVRMGLNSGVVSAGNMGSAARFSYTVMGDAVNQAARFEPANKDYDTLIMMGESTYQLAKDHVESRLLDKIIVKGKTVPIQIYELVAKKGEISDEKRRILDLYNQGLELHWERKWDEALAAFAEALAIDENDGPSIAMAARVESYKESPPPEAWQGEFVRTSKD